jgi:hypothetical protein
MEWDEVFEINPDDNDEAKYGAREIRNVKIATREREDLEHNFSDGAPPFHKAGLCAVVFVGTTAEIAALTGMVEGAMAFDTELRKFKRYTSAVWEDIVTTHDGYSGLLDDDHPQYLHLDKAGQTLQEDLALDTGILLDGIDVTASSDTMDDLIYVTSGVINLSFVITEGSAKEIRRGDSGDFETDGFVVGDCIYTSSGENPGPFTIASISATVITVNETIISESSVYAAVFIIREGFQDWVSTGYSYGTNYLAAVDCFICGAFYPGYFDDDSAGKIGTRKTINLYGYTGPSSPATILRSKIASRTGLKGMFYEEWDEEDPGPSVGFIMPVQAGEYWRVDASIPSGIIEDVYYLRVMEVKH